MKNDTDWSHCYKWCDVRYNTLKKISLTKGYKSKGEFGKKKKRLKLYFLNKVWCVYIINFTCCVA